MSKYGFTKKEREEIKDDVRKGVLASPVLAEMKSECEELWALRSIVEQLNYKYWKTDEGWRYSKIDA